MLTRKQLPLGLLTAAQGHPMLVELKNGETLNGHLVNCDNWMNLTLKEVVQTSPEGDRFYRLPEVYVRGNNVCDCVPPQISVASADHCARSNTSESPKRLSTLSKSNNSTTKAHTGAAAVDEAMAETEAEVAGADGVVDVAVVTRMWSMTFNL